MSPFVWLAIAAIAAIVEVFSWGLFTMWFVIGGLLAFVVGFLGGPLWLQIVVFLVVSVACLLLLRPLILKHRKQGEEFEATPVGGTAVVVERIDNGAHVGRVETSDHMTWAAISADDSILEPGTRVRVTDKKSIKLVVEGI